MSRFTLCWFAAARGIRFTRDPATASSNLKPDRKTSRPTPITGIAAALGLSANLLAAFAEDSGSFYRPLTLAPLAPSDDASAGGATSNATSTAQGKIDLNDPQVLAATSEAMDHPISELMAVWN